MKISKGFGTPGSRRSLKKGLAKRADEKLNAVASAYAEDLESVLSVDGVPVLIWNRTRGSFPCSCKADVDTSRFTNQPVSEEEAYDPDTPSIESESHGTSQYGFSPVSELFANKKGSSGVVGQLSPDTRKKIRNADTLSVMEEADYADKNFLPLDLEPDTFTSSSNPLFQEADSLLSAVFISCPICLGSGKVDAWVPSGCHRILLETSGFYDFELYGASTNKANGYTQFSIFEDEFVEWELNLPFTWKRLLRFALFNGKDIVKSHKYKVELLFHDSTSMWLNRDSLMGLKGDSRTKRPLKLRLYAVGETLVGSHLDIIYLENHLLKAQLPEVDIPYEEEFIDWNLTISVELSARARIKEGSYLVDSKYGRTWKVDSYTSKKLASNKIFGHTASCRALHSFETMFTTFNIFKKNIL